MMKLFLKITFTILLGSSSYVLFSQHVLDQKIHLNKQLISIQDVLDEIEDTSDVVFSFDPNKVFTRQKFQVKDQEMALLELLERMFIGQSLQFKAINNRVLILPQIISYINISGYVFNEESREVLPSALIIDELSGQSIYADDQGFYHLKVIQGLVQLSVYYLGNIRVKKKVAAAADDMNLDFYLPTDYNLDSVVIISKKGDPFTNVNSSGEKIINYIRQNYKGKLGQSEVFENVRMLSGVQSGNEAQGGFYVRGGSADQNLILMDGIPLYEVSHIGGLSSIFMDDMIRNVDLVKSGIPARYGGRLSSVLDVKLKEGNKKKTNTVFDIGLDALHLHMDGPLVKERLTFNFSLRKSLLNGLVSPLFSFERGYDKLDLNYYDSNFKLTYHINKKHKLSLLAYAGQDKIGIFRDSTESSLKDQSKIGWGTSLLGLNYQYKISDKLFLQLYANVLDYSRSSRGEYSFKPTVLDTISNELEVLVSSKIVDNNIKIELDYKWSKNNILRFGANRTLHQFNPTLYKSKELLDGEIKIDTTIHSKEYYIFLEDNIRLDDVLDIYGGIHWSSYHVRQKTYNSLQPRLSMKWHPIEQLSITTSVQKMAQNIHFLTNPGLGLPSELWIPSTEHIEPQEVIQYGVGASLFTSKLLRMGVDFYIKKYDKVLEYDETNDLFYAFILNESSIDFTGFVNWEDHLEVGRSEVKSWEFYVFKKWANFNFAGSYNWSKHERFFENINDGEPFLSKYDRTHDINLKTNYTINNHWTLTASWIYGSGNTYTLPLEEVPLLDTLGTVILSSGRNNLRFPAFHHLDIAAKYKRVYEYFRLDINMGVYNVYNRLNPFYVYLYKDNEKNRIVRRGVSLFPIVPFINIRFTL